MDDDLKQIIKLDYITLEFYEYYVIGTPEPINMGLTEIKELGHIANKFYTGNFGYIGNRKNLNSVDPMGYSYVEKHLPRAIAIAVVSYSDYTQKFLKLEKKFLTGKFQFKVFTELKEAKTWMFNNFTTTD